MFSNIDPPAAAWRRLLDVSTAHLTPSTREKMGSWDHNDCSIPTFAPHAHGWFMWVATEDDSLLGLPADLVDVLQYARAQRAEYILFDADAAELDGLDSYEDEDETVPATFAESDLIASQNAGA